MNIIAYRVTQTETAMMSWGDTILCDHHCVYDPPFIKIYCVVHNCMWNVYISHLVNSNYHYYSLQFSFVNTAWVVKIRHTKNSNQCLSFKNHICLQWRFSSHSVSNLFPAGALGIWCPRLPLLCPQGHQGHSSLILSVWADWHVLGGVNTEGSFMPSCTSKNRVDSSTL